MKFSEIVGEQFFNIKLSISDYELIDIHFQAGSSHYWRYRQAIEFNINFKDFHGSLSIKHSKAMMDIISKGDFSNAQDSSNKGLEDPEMWDSKRIIPYSGLYDFMVYDTNYKLGEYHGYDNLVFFQEEEAA